MSTTDSTTPALSVLDLVPVRTAQTSAEAVASSMALAQRADELGYRRYWFAEHHNMPAVASTTPPVLAAAAAARTTHIRLGSGGVMLPNHAPLLVAEQFAALEALAPGRIDLGLGRAPGSDPVVTQLLRTSGTTSDVDHFPDHIHDIIGMLQPAGARITFTTGRTYDVHSTPASTEAPDVWLLGSSDYSAHLAARMGLPYVFANHFAGLGAEQALSIYRNEFQASEWLDAPRTILTANVVAAPSTAEAEERALPHMRMNARMRQGLPLVPIETVEQSIADAASFAASEAQMQAGRRSWFVGTGAEVAAGPTQFAARFGLDEVMVVPITGAYDAEAKDAAGARGVTLELIAAAR